jgi:hypothetical protein
MREWSFKNQTQPEIKAAVEAHVMATEYLMLEKAKENPAYLEQVMAIQGFPIFFPPPMPPVPEMPPPQPGMSGAPAELPMGEGEYVGEPGEEVAPEMPTTSAQLAAENALPAPVSGMTTETIS